mmetsp:Transcript_60176/g.95545  ORF Transcript_60176/g.95545 Transcript_60176/m.95545 type:complete len:243 (-) Transcript_60176:306-1034(-)
MKLNSMPHGNRVASMIRKRNKRRAIGQLHMIGTPKRRRLHMQHFILVHGIQSQRPIIAVTQHRFIQRRHIIGALHHKHEFMHRQIRRHRVKLDIHQPSKPHFMRGIQHPLIRLRKHQRRRNVSLSAFLQIQRRETIVFTEARSAVQCIWRRVHRLIVIRTPNRQVLVFQVEPIIDIAAKVGAVANIAVLHLTEAGWQRRGEVVSVVVVARIVAQSVGGRGKRAASKPVRVIAVALYHSKQVK